MNIVGQNEKTVLDPTRVVQCGLCKRSLTVAEIQQLRGHCPNPECGALLCAFCGCSDQAPCIDDRGMPCSWEHYGFSDEEPGPHPKFHPGMCDLCFIQIADLMYFELLDGEARPFKEPRRPNLV